MLIERHEPDRVERDGQRFYRTPGGLLLPSVTTVLKATPDPEKERRLADWRERAGPEEVAKVEVLRDEGAERGTKLHAGVEAWVDDPFSDGPQETDDPWWNSIVPFLRDVVLQPLLIESAVWNELLGYGGTLDMVAIVRPDILALIDWKSARKKKERKWIQDFEQQAAAYVAALNRMAGLKISHAVIVVAYEGTPADTFWMGSADLVQAFEEFKNRLRAFHRAARR